MAEKDRASRDKDRVHVQAASIQQMGTIEGMLKQRGLWSEDGCKCYHGKSLNKADLTNTKEAWEGKVYFVMCNGVATVALNFEVSFGACFMLTSNQPNVALCRDLLQGVVRSWRRQALEPHVGAMGRGRDGRCTIYALLGCKAPTQLASSLNDRKKGKGLAKAISPVIFAEWLQTQ